jgi:hypothetical protein
MKQVYANKGTLTAVNFEKLCVETDMNKALLDTDVVKVTTVRGQTFETKRSLCFVMVKKFVDSTMTVQSRLVLYARNPRDPQFPCEVKTALFGSNHEVVKVKKTREEKRTGKPQPEAKGKGGNKKNKKGGKGK